MKLLRAIRLKMVLLDNALDNWFANMFDNLIGRNKGENDVSE